MPDCPGLCDNTEPFIEFDDVTDTGFDLEAIPMAEHTIDPEARQVIPFMVILEIGTAPRKGSRDLRDSTCPVTNRPSRFGCFDRY